MGVLNFALFWCHEEEQRFGPLTLAAIVPGHARPAPLVRAGHQRHFGKELTGFLPSPARLRIALSSALTGYFRLLLRIRASLFSSHSTSDCSSFSLAGRAIKIISEPISPIGWRS